MPNLTFSGGTLTNAAGNNGDGNGNYSMYGNGTTCALTTLSNNKTAVISAARISFQSPTTFNIAAGNVSGGATPGVDLLVTSAMTPFGIQPVTKIGNGVLALDANTTNSFADSITISNGAVQLGTANDVLDPLTTPMGTGLVTNYALLNFASSQSVTVSYIISGRRHGAGGGEQWNRDIW